MSDLDVRPMHAPTDRISEAGILAWAVALVATLAIPALHAGDRWWWPWCCATGVVLGFMGWGYLRRGKGNAADLA